MNTTDNSSADALTVPRELLLDLIDDVQSFADQIPCREREKAFRADLLARARAIAASPVERPAAAPNEDHECVYENGDGIFRECAELAKVGRTAPSPADERAALPRYTEWLHLRTHGEWSDGVPEWARDHTGRMNDFTAASAVIEELAAARATSAIETGAPIGWAWVSPTGHISRFIVDFDGKHDQLATGWKVRPVAFCDSAANETGAEGADEPYLVMLDVRDLFAYLRAAWREGQHYDREDMPDQADSWSAASDYANKTIERWTLMRPVTVRSPAAAAEAHASAGVIAAARAVIEADRAQTLTTEHVNALDNAIKIQHGELSLPEPRAGVTLFADNDERDEFVRACQDFDEDGETDVDYGLLMKWTVARLLDCDHFTITKKGRTAIETTRKGEPQ
ncbi:hypothetical protein SB394_11810 [Burkholderia sp. BCCIQ04A]|uniref:DUF551 domain-containing protein n=1 Tax=Burkholderia anthinoferrum TaxID=3090833 RepID=A0ABU5WP98_9BURK|nr:hypothetical protein [Burkholderia anthinoferrum]MEB2504597.1 hypothetical protein [Burkholderia anthinoferrum]MEB2530266.1 hypothetical protein [Burkholderia anthinoferrum]MEB2561639.1 hypothetical protein [Burkholderia anthinoferrum]MEB2580611.1 hypothetical protein [Burkholderia anthinoferrum]MEB2634411.1 hypothetical protein [Burkholderia anthinoferrum]